MNENTPKNTKTGAPADLAASTPNKPKTKPSALPGASPYEAATQSTDRVMHAQQSRFTMGLSPASLLLAYADWFLHLANSPGKLGELQRNTQMKGAQFLLHLMRSAGQSGAEPFIAPLPEDRRFAAPEWKEPPFNLLVQSFLLTEQWWHYATAGVRGVSKRHEAVMGFTTRQMLDMFAPSNIPWLNPEVIRATVEQGGQNLVRGMNFLADDIERNLNGKRPTATADFRVGRDVAVTPGKVIYRNDLMELIQYAPATGTVHPEPVLIVPAWIMKYYILDLSPENSLVRYLVEQGHTVFCISWKNPGPDDRDMGMDDYRRLGAMAALDAISAVCPGQKVHTAGYCLGGTILSIAAAAMARDGDDRLASVTLMAAQIDFEDAGEIMLFIDESQVVYLEDMMWDQGVLDTAQMAGAFQILRSNDLIWSRVVRQYLLGESTSMNDLMAWNSDATRMPYRMHSEYLRKLFLENELAKGRYHVDGSPVAMSDIRAPLFAVGTVKDHVAPWKSVYKAHILTDTDVTFVLTAGGHNAGIVSEPGHKGRRYQAASRAASDKYIDPDTWARTVPVKDGSWWEEWQAWLAARSSAKAEPPPMGNARAGIAPIMDAPGQYVLQN